MRLTPVQGSLAAFYHTHVAIRSITAQQQHIFSVARWIDPDQSNDA
jgi:hypothetical protein